MFDMADPAVLSGATSPLEKDVCKICGGVSDIAFALPMTKLTGHEIPAGPDDCKYFQCQTCNFCYTRELDDKQHDTIYDDDYWKDQDPDWYGRVYQTFRLVALANQLRQGHLPDLEILDFGCGIGGFLEVGKRDLGLNIWGTDIIPPRTGLDRFLRSIEGRKFDIIVACEVIEHLPQPLITFDYLRAHLKPFGVLAFQTAQWDPAACDRTWWYIGPANGHISLYSAEAFDALFTHLNGRKRANWNYLGVQAWQFEEKEEEKAPVIRESALRRLIKKSGLI